MQSSKWDKYLDESSANESENGSADRWDQYLDDTSSSIPSAPKFNQEQPSAFGKLKQNIPKWYEQAMSGLGGAKNQIMAYPTRAAANIAGGIADIPGDILNLPFQYHNAVKNLEKIYGIGSISPELPSEPFSYHSAEHFRKWLGIPEGDAPGDTTLQMLGPNALALAKVPRMASKALNAGRLEKLDALKSHLHSTGFDASEAERILKEAESASKKTHGIKGEEALQFSQNENAKKIAELKEKAAVPIEKPNKPNEPNYPKTVEYEETEPMLKAAHDEQVKKVGETEAAIKEHLGEGQIHHERFANLAKSEHLTKYEEPNQKAYKELETSLSEVPVELPNKNDTKALMERMSDELKQSNMDVDKIKALEEEINKLKSGRAEEISAREVLRLYRGARDARFAAVNEFKAANDTTRPAIKARIDNLSRDEKSLWDLLETNLKEKNPKALKSLNKAQETFKTKIAPLRTNTLWREITKTGKVKGNILEKLVGNEKGLEVVQDLVHANPELKRLAVGQSFAKKPAGLFGKNDILNRYLPSMHELRDLMKSHKLETEHLESIKKLLFESKIKDLTNANKADKIKSQISKMQSDYVKELEQYEKHKASYKKDLATQEKRHKQIMELEAENANKKKTMEELQAKTKIKNQTLEQKVKAEKAYNAAKEEYDLKNGRIRKLITRWGLPTLTILGGSKYIWNQI